MKKNVLLFPDKVYDGMPDEYFEDILTGGGSVRVERIVSYGHTTPQGTWYDQEQDEWVLVLEGEAKLLLEEEGEFYLEKGHSLYLAKHCKHRVVYTSSPCVWLAIYGDNLSQSKSILNEI